MATLPPNLNPFPPPNTLPITIIQALTITIYKTPIITIRIKLVIKEALHKIITVLDRPLPPQSPFAINPLLDVRLQHSWRPLIPYFPVA